MDYKDMGMRIRAARRRMGLTQEQLAEKADISASFMGHLERGTRVASLETLITLCNELEVKPEYLLSASLRSYNESMPEDLNERERTKLSEFLRLAQDTVRNWND